MTDSIVQRIRSAYVSGLAPKQIAHLVGRSTRTVQKALVPRPKLHCTCFVCRRDRDRPLARGINTGIPAVQSAWAGHATEGRRA